MTLTYCRPFDNRYITTSVCILIVAEECFFNQSNEKTKCPLHYFAGSLRSAARQVQRTVRKSVRDEIGRAGDEEEVEDRDKELKEEQDQHQRKGRGKGKGKKCRSNEKPLKRPAAAVKDDKTPCKAAKLESIPVPDEEEEVPPTQEDPKSPDAAEPPTPKKPRRRKGKMTPEEKKNQAKKATPKKSKEPHSDDAKAKDHTYLDRGCLGIDVTIKPVQVSMDLGF